ncbi:hypothetical protein ACLOJK_036986 [Asimina triloba]
MISPPPTKRTAAVGFAFRATAACPGRPRFSHPMVLNQQAATPAASFHEQRAATSAPPKSASQQPCSATIKRGVAHSSKIGRHLHEPASANEPAIIRP